MKKTLLTMAIAVISVITSTAQNITGNCYRGFADVGYNINLSDVDVDNFEINTSHGYQINPIIFVGGGAGLHFSKKLDERISTGIPFQQRDSKVDVPVFANVRVNFLKTKVTPYIDLKAGTFVNNNGGKYLQGAIGCRIATNQRSAINVSVGYSIKTLEYQQFNKFVGKYSMDYTMQDKKTDVESVNIKVGYEF